MHIFLTKDISPITAATDLYMRFFIVIYMLSSKQFIMKLWWTWQDSLLCFSIQKDKDHIYMWDKLKNPKDSVMSTVSLMSHPVPTLSISHHPPRA